ncbi:MAG: PEP/pyruvate-binding domain-containing protein [Streptosporangiaceae bacterium]
MAATGLVCPLRAAGVGDRAVVGGKGASLGELGRAGLPVPPGFVVTAAAFRRQLRAADPAGTLTAGLAALPADDTAAIERAAAAIRARITAVPLPADLTAAVTAEYDSLRAEPEPPAPGAPVAVRSSAVAEDAADASFAGLQDTYLWVRGAGAVLDHVRRCWASLYNAEAVTYRLRRAGPAEDAAMAVVVQRMVDPRSAGVMFTCSPTTGDRSVIAIEGTWGLGSALVSGEVTPDSFVVSKVTGEIVRRTIAAKMRLHRVHPSGCGTAVADVAADLREQPCLGDDEIRALAGLGRQAERHFGTPQDIEWAVTGPAAGREIVLLQSRAETVWTARVTAAIAGPKARPADHVFEQLSRTVLIRGATADIRGTQDPGGQKPPGARTAEP